MDKKWKRIRNFLNYSVSNFGEVRSDKTGRILSQTPNQYGLLQIGMIQDGIQKHRSVPLLVANAFVPRKFPAFDTPINLDGDRYNNRSDNLAWRPRWFAIKYNRQFKYPYDYPIVDQIIDLKTGEISANSFECSKQYGLLEEDLVQSIFARTYVWPTYQEFALF